MKLAVSFRFAAGEKISVGMTVMASVVVLTMQEIISESISAA